MCGITGIVNFNSSSVINKEQLKQMTESLTHRGPDDDGIFINEGKTVGLGHRRLSIIDLSSGHQPMANRTGEIWIVFNGEIYNYPELKKELQQKGSNFNTNSDTEVIINLYEKYGEKEFHRLNGIFAFAIYDSRNNTIILARDHFGVKPLYYTFQNNTLIFGSEIKSIMKIPFVKKEIDFDALNNFLTLRYNPSPQTLFEGIRKLTAGHYLKFNSSHSLEIKSIWDYKPYTDNKISFNDALTEYQILLEKAVKRQMISDVPVGLLLSGGVDSAVIGKLMQDYSAERIKTFSIGFSGSGDYNELSDAKKTADFIKSDHYDLTLTKNEYLDFFVKSFYYTEEPIAEATIPALFYVSKLASRHVKVVLAGQGADEPLAGYDRYYGEKILNRYSTLLRYIAFDKIIKIIPRNEKLKRAAYSSKFNNELSRFIAIYTIFNQTVKKNIFKKEFSESISTNGEFLFKEAYDNSKNLGDSLSKILFLDTRLSLPDDLLLFGDKMTMANSLEMRVPFLDVELIKFLESLPSSFKLKGRIHKYIHKQAVKKWLPDEIIYRKKRGFATPMDEWLQNDFSDTARDLLNDSGSFSRSIYNIEAINKMIELHKKRKENFQRQIFLLLSLELWYNEFYKKIGVMN